MALRTAHGTGRRGSPAPRVEVSPVDELPTFTPANETTAKPVEDPTQRLEGGRFAPGNQIAHKAKGVRKGEVRLAAKLGIAELAETEEFAPYKRSARVFRRAQVNALARDVGGGVCGIAASSFVSSAALQLAASRYLFDRAAITGDPADFASASRLADASRQNLLAAHELCAREAQARPRAPVDPLARWLAPAEGDK